MNLKIYQQNTLDILQRFFEACRISGAEGAYRAITNESEIAARLGKLRGGYERWPSIPNTPRVCLKVPTGGGKTIIAAHAIKIVADTWLERDCPIVLWFTPSDTIRRQTSEALKNPRHHYRVALDGQFGGRVRIFDLEEKFNIRPADIESGVCVIVSTVQAFRQSNTDKYKVYAHHEDLEPHFSHIPKIDGMELNDSGSVKFSFANLLHHHRPIIIVDEAHNVITGLSQEMQGRINPSAIVELTATPRINNNTLYNVRATELKEEEMIKLPIELREHLGWEQAVDEAIAKRAELEKDAENETEYIRPILLFQAQDKNNEINVDVLKKYLIDTGNIPENEIAVATGDQKQLDGVNVFARDCPVKYVITVEALKEGWDCSFAYILCSLANVRSDTAVEQLLGRVMRMPYAKMRKTAALNKAYAYVISKSFGEAAAALVDKLKNKGFDETEAHSTIEQKQSELPGLFGRSEIYKIDLDEPLFLEEPSLAFYETENNGKTLVFTPETNNETIERIIKLVPPEKAVEIQYKFYHYKRTDTSSSPAQSGAKIIIPRLMVELQGELVFADSDAIFEVFDWNIANFAKPRMDSGEFDIEQQGNGFTIDIDGHKLAYSPTTGAQQLSLPLVDVENWTPANLIIWLDKTLRQDDIPQAQMIEWLRQTIEYLTDTRGIKLSSLMLAKYALANKIRAKINDARKKARANAFQIALFEREARVMLDFDKGFEFRAGMYDSEMLAPGNYKFLKHFFGPNKIPAINGEEFECAKAIDRVPQVKYWLRNVSRHPSSFRLPTGTDNFYPDFVAELEDGRILVVEYKGDHIIDTRDTKEKRTIGELWEKQSKGRGIFMIAEKSKDGMDVGGQVGKRVGGIT